MPKGVYQHKKGSENPNWKGGKVVTSCSHCKSRLQRYPYQVNKGRLNFCNLSCRAYFYHKVSVHPMLGKKRTEMHGQKNWTWKGENVGYLGLHRWVQRWLGEPDTCEHCGKSGLQGRKIHWANKSRKYLRDLSDWIRLCVKCHKKFDLEA